MRCEMEGTNIVLHHIVPRVQRVRAEHPFY
ncbi:hypothetical protein BSS2_I1576 [Brucella suis bv. 1 str. S2]|uniref:Uncharacterized protein n=2 Tax=Brucella TaxID=234 RepID=Q57BQ2_BRUAB|nr:hypothetical protein BR1624 [Brucella suis 1330]AAX74932.1 hypothetical protein BruAb1_1610 [Brucella abortus bv. 1 str. 9-941]AEU06613.1 hypothetical protein BSVBI22_A1618 [Brucella suis VBI22]AHN47229.1 hypothetical protein BSS2_I1576 [Brucella suis bv. 1 str. S2]CDL77007.1 unnamed protein product [Brucella canis str. Oliveri]